MMQTKLFLSNQIDALIDAFSEELFTKITKRKVVVPDEKMRNYFFFHIARTTAAKIAMGMDVVTLSQLLPEQGKKNSLQIEYWITTRRKQPLFEELDHYLNASQVPLFLFCDELERTFLEYALYGEKQIKEWLNKKGWQQELWKLCDFSLKLSEGYEWHVFGFNYLPLPYVSRFQEQEACFYILSPCREFWEDMCSDKERSRLRKKLSASQQEALEDFLQDQHPLLANMGKLGRKFLAQFQDSTIEERYVEILGNCCLEKLQASILSLTCFENKQDDSIQCYTANSLLEEVELLYASLHQLLTREKIEPKDVHVFASDINQYASLIHLVFGKEDSAIPYAIYDLDLASESSFAQGFLQLLHLPSQRFDVSSLLNLFSVEAFRERFGCSEAEVEKIEFWIEKTKVHWGIDKEQRNLLLGERMLEETDIGTWKSCCEKLLFGLVMLSPDFPSVKIAEAELLEKFIQFIQRIEVDLKPLYDGSLLSLVAWEKLLRDLAYNYFSLNEEDVKLLKKMSKLFSNFKDLEEPVFSFSSLLSVVENLFTSSTGKYKTSNLQTVLFSSFPKGSPTPKKVIWLLGMQEGLFPRKSNSKSLSEIAVEALSQTEKDRYLFLEMIISAQRFFCTSYTQISLKDHKMVSPSLVIQELFSFVQKPFFKPTKLPALHALSQSPPIPFFDSFCISKMIQKIDKKEERTIAVKQLEKCAKHPLKFYFQEKLGLYLERTKEKNHEFILPNYEKARLRENALRIGFEGIQKDVSLKEKLPLGRFKESALLKLEEELEKTDFDFGEIHSHDFQNTPFVLPLKEKECVIFKGVLEKITSKGLLFYGKKQISDLLKIWPSYLLYLNVAPQAYQKNLCLLKDGKILLPPEKDAKELLISYLEYYTFCLQVPSPLMPEWAKPLLQGKKEEFEKSLQGNQFSFYKDEYLEWLEMRHGSLEALFVYEEWFEKLRTLFDSFLTWSSQ